MYLEVGFAAAGTLKSSCPRFAGLFSRGTRFLPSASVLSAVSPWHHLSEELILDLTFSQTLFLR